MNIKLIVGLSNPGKNYSMTRHNIGSLFVNLLTNKYEIKLTKKNKFLGYIGKINFNKNNIYLFIPNVFINLSGKPVLLVSKFYNIKVNEILIVYDELTLLPGQIKFHLKKNYSTHNGIKNIVKELNSYMFSSLKIGIGHPGKKNNIIKFVLSVPNDLDKNKIKNSMKYIIKNIKYIIYKNPNKINKNFI